MWEIQELQVLGWGLGDWSYAGFGMVEIARNACLFFVNRNLHFKPE